jgi:hypothetical protein
MVEVSAYRTRSDAELAQAALSVAGIRSVAAADSEDAAAVLSGQSATE